MRRATLDDTAANHRCLDAVGCGFASVILLYRSEFLFTGDHLWAIAGRLGASPRFKENVSTSTGQPVIVAETPSASEV